MGCIRLDILEKSTVPLKVVYRKSDVGQKSEQRFTSVDPLADKLPDYSPYAYTLNNPINMIDPDGRFPIDPAFRSAYPLLTNYIENGLQGYFERNDNILAVLSKYSTGDLNLNQIRQDFLPDSGPELRVGNSDDAFNGHYDKTTNSITFNPEFLNNIENLLSKDGKKSTYGKFDFIELFIEEYIHYGDALDGMDLEISADGVLFNNPYSQEPCAPGCKFDEGNAGTGEIFKYGRNGRMYYNLFKNGVLTYPYNDQIIETNPDLINPSMIPE